MNKEEKVHHYGYERFHWDGMELYHEGIFMAELIPSEKWDKQYHLKFMWRDEPTPEFFNIFNARENCKRCALYRLNYDMWEQAPGASQESLNEH